MKICWQVCGRKWCCCILPVHSYLSSDPAHARDPSGCTAVAALVTSDGEIYVVCQFNSPCRRIWVSQLTFRPMLAILDRSLVSRGKWRLSVTIINLQTTVKRSPFTQRHILNYYITIAVEKVRIHGAGGYVEYGRVNGQPCSGKFSLCFRAKPDH